MWGCSHPRRGSAASLPAGRSGLGALSGGMRDAPAAGTARGCPSHPPHPSGRGGGRGRRDGRGEQPVRGEGPSRAGPRWAGPGAWLGARRGEGRPQPLALRHSQRAARSRGAAPSRGQRPAPRHGRPGRQRAPGGHHLRLRRWVRRGAAQGAAALGLGSFGARPGGAAAAAEWAELGWGRLPPGSDPPGLGCRSLPVPRSYRGGSGRGWAATLLLPTLPTRGCPRAAGVFCPERLSSVLSAKGSVLRGVSPFLPFPS